MSNIIYSSPKDVNWNDSRNISRLKKIQTFAQKSFKRPYETITIHTHILDEIFGNHSNKTTKFLKEQLLIRDRSVEKMYIVGKKSLSYQFNWNNLANFLKEANLDATLDNFAAKKQIVSFNDITVNREAFNAINNTLDNVFNKKILEENVEYKECEVTKRLLNNIQNISKAKRKKIFQGWFDYDIEACAYTLVHQHFINRVLPLLGEDDHYPTIPQVYTRKNEVREELSRELDIPIVLVKELLQHILFNAKLNKSPFSGFYKKMREYNVDQLMFFYKVSQNEFLQNLISEIQEMWPKLMDHWDETHDIKGRDHFRKPTSKGGSRYRAASFRAGIYFSLEREVLDVVRTFMKSMWGSKVCHLIHDGFFTKTEINIPKLQDFIQKQTTFKVKYSFQQF